MQHDVLFSALAVKNHLFQNRGETSDVLSSALSVQNSDSQNRTITSRCPLLRLPLPKPYFTVKACSIAALCPPLRPPLSEHLNLEITPHINDVLLSASLSKLIIYQKLDTIHIWLFSPPSLAKIYLPKYCPGTMHVPNFDSRIVCSGLMFAATRQNFSKPSYVSNMKSGCPMTARSLSRLEIYT
jgi:hypothetical protein